MQKNNFFIITGAMGAGKTAIADVIRKKRFTCIDEPARKILAEQRSYDGAGVPEKNPELFNQLMLSRSVNQYLAYRASEDIIFFDRGIPDMIAYAKIFNVNDDVYRRASSVYMYNKCVFILYGDESIYTTDDERKVDFEIAREFGESTSSIYSDLGYELVDIPMMPVSERADFILTSALSVIKQGYF